MYYSVFQTFTDVVIFVWLCLLWAPVKIKTGVDILAPGSPSMEKQEWTGSCVGNRRDRFGEETTQAREVASRGCYQGHHSHSSRLWCPK